MNRPHRRIAVILSGVLGAAIGVSSPAQAVGLNDLRWQIESNSDEISDFAEDNEADQKALALELSRLADEQDERDRIIADLREQEGAEPAVAEGSGEPSDGEPTEGIEPGSDGEQSDDAEQLGESAPEEEPDVEDPAADQPGDGTETGEPEEHVITGSNAADAGSGTAVKSDGVFVPAVPKPVYFLNNPLSYMYVTSSYGLRYHPTLHYTRLHSGTDFRAPCGTAILAAQSGIVLSAKWNGTGGNTIMIDHGTTGAHNIKTRYLHLSKMQVNEGQVVSMGEQVGLSGMTGGISTGCHLHFEVLLDDETVDPLTQLQFELPAPATIDAALGPVSQTGTDVQTG